MLLKRVEIDPDSTFFVLNSAVDAFRRLVRADEDTPRALTLRLILSALGRAAENGWFYVNPRDESQLIAYCDVGRKPFWLVVAPGDRDGFKHTEKDYVCVTCLGHRDSKFADAIAEHRASTAPESPP